MISNDRRQRTLQESILELSHDLVGRDVEAFQRRVTDLQESVDPAVMVECLGGVGQMLVEQFSVLLGTTSSRSEALRLLPIVMDTAADDMVFAMAGAEELVGAVGIAASLVECVQFGTVDDIADLLDAARCDFADVDILSAVAAFSAALTEQIAAAYSLRPSDVHEQFIGPVRRPRSTAMRTCSKPPRAAASAPVRTVAAVRGSCTFAVSSSVA